MISKRFETCYGELAGVETANNHEDDCLDDQTIWIGSRAASLLDSGQLWTTGMLHDRGKRSGFIAL
jgi:hypothetical protein